MSKKNLEKLVFQQLTDLYVPMTWQLQFLIYVNSSFNHSSSRPAITERVELQETGKLKNVNSSLYRFLFNGSIVT